jgi:putative DNA methylase
MTDDNPATEPVGKRKLIEVALPLEAINRESAREKSIRHGHPSTLHLWWARRPLAAARAVLFAQLVDDPSSRPDEFPTEELQRKERDRLHALIERLVVWENTRDEKLLAEAHAEILKSTNGNPPPILDPFAGGGTIPLEAQRLGLEAHASDLNPVAVLINKALIEIPPKFRDQPPVFPGVAESEIRTWQGTDGLATDIRAYGNWIRKEATKRIGPLYPMAMLPDNTNAAAIAWIWARTVVCPNPACSAEVPLISSLDLRNKKGHEVWLRPVVHEKRVTFEITSGPRQTEPNKRGQGAKFECWVCGAPIVTDQLHAQLDVKVKPPHRLLAVVTAGNRQRVYTEPTAADEAAVRAAREEALQIRDEDTTLNAEARGTFGGNAQGRRYGFFTFADYFTDRQLIALSTFSDLIEQARGRIMADGGSADYAAAIVTYLAMALSKLADRGSSIVTWFLGRESTRNTFARQAIPMTWDFVEPNPLADGTGTWRGAVAWTAEALAGIPSSGPPGTVSTADATAKSYADALLSTDPPYYDNIVYSDLSDFFYVWLRRTLRDVYPDLFSTLLVPKSAELVANPYRHNGKQGAKNFFEKGFREVFARARETALDGFPITVYYAFKQSESGHDGQASTGWETLLEGMIHSGWEITSTWPNRSELSNRMVASGSNALASSIVLSLRPRVENAPTADRRGFISALEAELPNALRRLEQGQIAPVDLPQAAIGPGMAVFSRYSSVLESDGSKMTVRSALGRINEVLDQVLNEQEGDFDATSRFAIAWYRQHGYGTGKFGDADNLARARNTSVDTMDRDGILMSRAGNVALIKPADLHAAYDVIADHHTSNWEGLHHLIRILEQDGISAAGEFLRSALSREDRAIEADLVKELAHLLFRIAEGNGWTKDALSFNNLVTSWPEIFDAARSATPTTTSQTSLDFEEDGD